MAAVRLTEASVRNAKADPSRRREIADAGEAGLYLVVQPSGVRSWAWRYRWQSKPKKLTIGPVAYADQRNGDESQPYLGLSHTLAEARVAARSAAVMLAKGEDPAAAKVAAKQPPADPEANTLRRHAELFIKLACKGKNRTWAEQERQLKVNVYPVLGGRDIATVTKRDIIELIDAIAHDEKRPAPIMANRVLATLRRFWNWLIGRGVVDVSPCAGIPRPAAERTRDRVLTWDELAAVWRASGEQGAPFGTLFQMLILTAQRREEVTGLARRELDTDQAVWTIPAARAKNGKEHHVPLSAPVLALIASVKSIGNKGWLFTTTGETPVSGHSKAKARLDKALAFDDDAQWTLHDLRRTAATGMAELGENPATIEAILNHVSGTRSGVAGIYNRYDLAEEKRQAMTAWGRFLTDIVLHDKRRAAYAKLQDRRGLRAAVHADDEGWATYLATLDGGAGSVVRLATAEGVAA